MSSNKQWDISKALAVASLFNFFHNVGKFCVLPFLTIYFRQLGLTAPLVGIVMGVKHLIYVFWAPLCSYCARSNGLRRILVTGSLLSSVGAVLLLTLIPPLNKDILAVYCNASLPWSHRLTTPGTMGLSLLGHGDNNISFVMIEGPRATPGMSTIFVNSSNKSLISSPALEITTALVKALEEAEPTFDLSRVPPTLETSTRSLTSPSGKERMSEQPSGIPSSTSPTLMDTNHNSADGAFSGDGSDLSLLPTATRPSTPSLYISNNRSAHKKKARNVNVDISDQSYFFDAEHKTFLMVLGAVILWEVLAAPLEWTADDSLYEYLDFVDATDRHGKLWIWGYLGACLGASSIALLVDNLNCFLIADIPRVAVHFYGYVLFIVITLLLSAFYPIHVSEKTEHTNKTAKALGLIGNDGRIILLAVTVFLTGAVGSTANNFLFWQMQDVGSSELYMGASIAVSLLSEILLYIFRTNLLKAVRFRWTVVLGLSCLAVQLLYYSFLWTPWAVLPIQLLSAFSNGALWWAVHTQADDVATPGTERSLQLVLHSLSYGFGASIGSFASGFIIASFSLAILYQACCVALVLWIIMFLLVHPRLPHQKKINYSRLLAADTSDMSDSEEEHDRDWLVKAMEDENFNKKW
ncbi:major facilitator superfamily domain-containing protein 6-like [Ascaphus truei]|uniref:major facilitator superfamily domain-containing protein 6-like n=1 Tax=Ascaphus truei TaxID=8439 RepID=UPI003F5A808E